MTPRPKKPEYKRPEMGPGSEVRSLTLRQRIQLGIAAWDRDDFETALQHFSAVIKKNPTFADIRNKAGLCEAMMGNPHSALEQFDAALAINEDYAEAHLNKAIVLNEVGRFEDAWVSFKRASELDTRDDSSFPSDGGNKLAIAHARTGDIYLAADRPIDAATEYEKALSVRARFADIRTKLAEAYLEVGRIDDARTQLETILEERPEFTGARMRLGVVLHKQGDLKGARSAWERCSEERPDDSRVRAYLAGLEVPSSQGKGDGKGD
ncbi:MAG: tetratricopeptide repeat protein [Longimicrobiales bacterium]